MPETFTYTQQEIKQLRLIVIALPIGAVFYCLVLVFMGMNGGDLASANTDNTYLRILHAVFTVAIIFMSKFVGDKVLAGTSTKSQSFFARYRSFVIVRLAMIEGATLFGGVVFMICMQSGKPDATYYLHLIPVVLLLLTAKSLYPTDTKLEDLRRRLEE